MKQLIILTLCVFALALCAPAQIMYSTEAGVGAYLSSTPHSAADLNLLIGSTTSSVASFTTIEIRPITTAAPSTTVRTGVQYTVASSGKFDLAGIAQGGGSSTAAGTSADFAGGGKISYYPGWSKAPGLYFAASLQALGDSSTGWDPQAALWIGYQFTGVSSAASLKLRRLIGRRR